MTKPQFNASISLGNILTAIALFFSVGGTWVVSQQNAASADVRIQTLEERDREKRADIRLNATAIRSLEMHDAGIDQRLKNIEQSVRRTERMLEQLTRSQGDSR